MAGPALPPYLAHPFSPAGRDDPFQAYSWFHENNPVHFDAVTGCWFVMTHAGCSAALSDRRFSASLGQRERARDDALPASMLTTDPPDHARLRGPGALVIGPAALQAAAGGVEEAVHRLLGELDGRDEADAAADIGEPFAIGVFASLFSLTPERTAAFAALARRLSVNLDPLAGPIAAAAGRAAAAEFAVFMDAHISDLDAAGTLCPLTRLAADRRLTREEMLGILSLSVVGGFVPLADLVGHAAYWITAAGETFGSACAPMPRGLVDELMRLATPIPFTSRVTTSEAALGQVTLPAGARLLLVIAAANRDPAVFENPGVLDPFRSPNPHLAFGGGPHLCLGAPLVRWAGGILLGALAARYPGLRQVGEAQWGKPLVPRRLRHQRLLLKP